MAPPAISPTEQRWRALSDALRVVNDLPSANELFHDRYLRLDAAIGLALNGAKERIGEIHKRFFDMRAESDKAKLNVDQADFVNLGTDFFPIG